MFKKFDDLSGQKIGMWLVLQRSDVRNKKIYYLCRCECGTERDVLSHNLRARATTSCGCAPKHNPKSIDLTGKFFNKWQVLKLESSRNKVLYYLCRCECGTERPVRGTHLTSGHSISCGCSFKHTDPDGPRLASAKMIFRKGYSDGDLLFEEFLVLSQKKCAYCDASPSNRYNAFLHKGRESTQFSKDNGDFIYNGLDRIDSNYPHNKNNLVPCCSICNYAKSNMSVGDFKDWILRAATHLSK